MSPIKIQINGDEKKISKPMNISQLLQYLELSSPQVAVELNRELVPRTKHNQVSITDGDTLEIVTLVGGG